MFDVMILGGGASGLMSAITCASRGLSVLIVDENAILGKKLLVTGNGRCNLTNINLNSKFYNQNIDKFFDKFNQKDTILFFKKLGLLTYSDEEGRVYPITNSAKSVADIFNYHLEKHNIKRLLNTKIISINQDNDSYKITLNNTEMYAKSIVFSVGGNSLNLLQNIDVDNRKNSPSLVALKTRENTKGLEGLRLNDVKVTLDINGKRTTEVGEVLIKEQGLSGIVIFNLSSHIARNERFFGKIYIDLLHNLHVNQKGLIQIIKSRCQQFEKIKDVFLGLINNKLAIEIMDRLQLNSNINSKSLSEKNINDIVKMLTNFEFNITDHYDNNQVYSGGVLLSALDENLQSLKYKNLYFAGEAIDVDGECGGYNLQWAWTSGFIVGNAIQKK